MVVACSEQEIADAIVNAGGNAVLTRSNHLSASNRVFEAVETFDPEGNFDAVINLHSDLPSIAPALIRTAFDVLEDPDVDISTLIAEITDDASRHDTNITKAVVALGEEQRVGRVLYVSRATVPTGDGPLYQHIGLLAFRRPALARFAGWPQGVLERREDLEQLRAIENGMRIDAVLVGPLPPSIETPADLEHMRQVLTRLH